MIYVIIAVGYTYFFLLGYCVGYLRSKNNSEKEYLRALKERCTKLENAINKTNKPVSHCPKCGDEVLGDEDGRCQNCI